MVRAAERPFRRSLPALLTVLLLALGLLVGTGTAASAAPPPPPSGTGGGPNAYTGELTTEQLALVLGSGVDRHEVLTTPGGAGSMRVEVVLGERAANALIAQGVPLQARTAAAAEASVATAGVFRPWSGPGGLREEFVALARAHPDLVEQEVIGRSVMGK